MEKPVLTSIAEYRKWLIVYGFATTLTSSTTVGRVERHTSPSL